MPQRSSKRINGAGPSSVHVAWPRVRNTRRSGLTLAELLIASSITAMAVAALGVFTKAVMDGSEHAAQCGAATQASRVVTARIANTLARSRQVLKLSDAARAMPGMDSVLIVWERDGEPADTAPGKPNFNELVIFAPKKTNPALLIEVRPQVDPALIAPMDQPQLLYSWIDRFRSGSNVVDPPITLLADLAGIHFDVDEYSEPEGIGGLVQQNVRIGLCISQAGSEPSVFFASASRRYATGN